MTEILSRSFYHKDTLEVAKSLLGCFLVRKIGRKFIRARIVETEAYVGEYDLACHASKGRTKRTEVMYGEAGNAYIYMIYGMYYCLNIVTEKKGFPAAVLIRAVEVQSPSAILDASRGLDSRLRGNDKKENGGNNKKENSGNDEKEDSGNNEKRGDRDDKEGGRNDRTGKGGSDKKMKTDGPGKLCRFFEIDRSLNGWDVTKGEKLWIERGKLFRNETIRATKRIGIDYAKHCREYLWRFVVEKRI